MRVLEVLEQRTAAERLAPAVSRDLGIQPDREHRRVGMRKIEREPHGRGRFVPGQDLVVADSIEHYNDELSKELTQLTVTANLHMRAIGFKPFIAPAYSSGAISLILTLRGEWHCGSVFLGGIFMGVKNRYTVHGLETEILPLPDALYERIVTAQENLKAVN